MKHFVKAEALQDQFMSILYNDLVFSSSLKWWKRWEEKEEEGNK